MVLYHDIINTTIKNQIGVQHLHFSELPAPAAAFLVRVLTQGIREGQRMTCFSHWYPPRFFFILHCHQTDTRKN